MRRTGFLGVALAGLVAGGAGCRSTCDHCSGPFSRLTNHNDAGLACREPGHAACADGVPVSLPRGGSSVPTPGWLPDAGLGFPVYPSGEPIPVSPGTAAPANELPYPTIPPQELPAQPVPAIPMAATLPPPASANTTGNPRQPR